MAERTFDVLRTAEDNINYAAFMQPFVAAKDECFTEEVFLKELDEMAAEWGSYLSRQYLCGSMLNAVGKLYSNP